MIEYFIYKNIENDLSLLQKETQKEQQKETQKMNIQNENIEIQECKEYNELSPISICIFLLFYISLGMYSAKLSWYSNTIVGWTVGYKVIFAIFAFMFPITYIIIYIIFKLDLITKINRKCSKISKK